MISLQVPGWAGATLAIDTFDTLATWEFDSRIGGDVASAYEVLADVAAWCAGNAFTSLPYPTFYVEVTEGGDGRLEMRLRSDDVDGGNIGGASYEASANLAALLGWASGAQLTTQPYTTVPDVAVDSALGTVFLEPMELVNWSRWSRNTGPVSRSGAWSRGVAGVELRRPGVLGYASEVGAVALADAIEAASTPRRAHIYQPDAEAWRLVTLGEVGVTRVDNLYRVALTVLG